MKTLGLENKVIIVTGAAGFLGREICKSLLEEKAIVRGIDIIGGNEISKVDIADVGCVEEYMKGLGLEIDGLVNNAALNFKAKDISEEDFGKTLEVNIGGCKNMITSTEPIMKRGGSIVNISSVYASVSPDFSIYDGNEELYSNVSYGASKAAMEQMTRYYARLYRSVRINSVASGGIYQGHSEDFVSKYSKRVPLGRMADSSEIVNSILFLLSDLASYITGHTLIVDGGMTV
jgi:NAD(P)-dependent dehydrogenase (short-subunit alcohol dehydrogenase family)